MDVGNMLLKNKRHTIIAALVLGEAVALALLWLSTTTAFEEIPQVAPAVAQKPAAEPTLDLQFLDPKPFEYYYAATNRNPFSGPAQRVVSRRQNTGPGGSETQPPPPPPPPKPKIEIVYLGTMATPEGKQAALIEDRYKKAQKFVDVGATLYDFTVSDFSEEQLVIQKPGSPPLKLRRGQATVIGEAER
jgi:hypothetical protein